MNSSLCRSRISHPHSSDRPAVYPFSVARPISYGFLPANAHIPLPLQQNTSRPLLRPVLITQTHSEPICSLFYSLSVISPAYIFAPDRAH